MKQILLVLDLCCRRFIGKSLPKDIMIYIRKLLRKVKHKDKDIQEAIILHKQKQRYKRLQSKQYRTKNPFCY